MQYASHQLPVLYLQLAHAVSGRRLVLWRVVVVPLDRGRRLLRLRRRQRLAARQLGLLLGRRLLLLEKLLERVNGPAEEGRAWRQACRLGPQRRRAELLRRAQTCIARGRRTRCTA